MSPERWMEVYTAALSVALAKKLEASSGRCLADVEIADMVQEVVKLAAAVANETLKQTDNNPQG